MKLIKFFTPTVLIVLLIQVNIAIAALSISLNPTSIEVAEGGSQSIALSVFSNTATIVKVTSDNPAVASVSGASFNFDADSNISQSIIITSLQDDNTHNNSTKISFSIQGNPIAAARTSAFVQVIDDDRTSSDPNPALAATISTTNISISEQNSGSYTIFLSSKPADNTTITITPNGNNTSALTLLAGGLAFNSDNWSVPQTVFMYAQDDLNTDNAAATITHTVSGGSFTVPDVTVKVNDDNTNRISYGDKFYKRVQAANGRFWLDRNLGASRPALSQNDSQSYGYLYQWGRGNDGHQLRTSGKTGTTADDRLAAIDTPSDQFIAYGGDWTAADSNLVARKNSWGNNSGTNAICPTGFKVPDKEEAKNGIVAVAPDISSGFNSFLKLPAAGFRNTGGNFGGFGNEITFWTTSSDLRDNIQTLSRFSTSAFTHNINGFSFLHPGYGFSVRCINNPNYTIPFTANPTSTITVVNVPIIPIVITGDSAAIYTFNPDLANGLTFTAPTLTTNGSISGIPTIIGKSTHRITATNSGGSRDIQVEFNIVALPPTINVSPTAIIATVNNEISPVIITASGGVASYSISPDLPAGLTFTTPTLTANGSISGAPTTLGSDTYTITASNTTGITTATVTITIDPRPTIIADLNILSAEVGVAISPITITAGGGEADYSISPDLPAGLIFTTPTLTTNGSISGTPRVAIDNTGYIITARSKSGVAANYGISITINLAAPTQIADIIPPTLNLEGNAKTLDLSQSFQSIGSSLTFEISQSALATIDPSSGILTITPTATIGSVEITVTATNTINQAIVRKFTVPTNPAKSPTAANLVIVNPTISNNQITFAIAETSGRTATITTNPITIIITKSNIAETSLTTPGFTSASTSSKITLTQTTNILPDTSTTITITINPPTTTKFGFTAQIQPTQSTNTQDYPTAQMTKTTAQTSNFISQTLDVKGQSSTYIFTTTPQLLSATPIKNQKIKLQYSDPTATTYNIYYTTQPPTNPNIFDHQKAQTTTTFYITPKLPLQPHFFIITTEDDFNIESNPSNQLQASPKK